MYKAYIKTSTGKELVAVKTGKGMPQIIIIPSSKKLMTLCTALFSTDDLEKLAKEVSTMLSFKHSNVMSLIGVCIDGEMPLLIMPFMAKGSVLEYVRNNKDSLLFVDDDCNADEVRVNFKFYT